MRKGTCRRRRGAGGGGGRRASGHGADAAGANGAAQNRGRGWVGGEEAGRGRLEVAGPGYPSLVRHRRRICRPPSAPAPKTRGR